MQLFLHRLLFCCCEAYFLVSSDFDSLGDAGIEDVLLLGPLIALPLELGALIAPPLLLELEAAPPAIPLLVEPLPDVVVSVELGADDVEDDEDGADVLGEGAGAGVVTFSSFLQAVRPIASMATRRSERFIFFPLGGHHTGLGTYERSVKTSDERFTQSSCTFYQLRNEGVLTASLQLSGFISRRCWQRNKAWRRPTTPCIDRATAACRRARSIHVRNASDRDGSDADSGLHRK